MNDHISRPFEAEESRIRAAYAKRQDAIRYTRFDPSCLFLVQERERQLLRVLSRYGCAALEGKKILEVGCGNGDLLRDFVKWGARPENIAGIDLLSERVAEAICVCPKTMQIQIGNAAKLQFSDHTFDLVLQSTVFTSVLDPVMKRDIASEMCRVLKPDGLILWYDYHVNNPWNPDVKGVKKKEIQRLFPNCRIELMRITLAPPLARLTAPYSWLACYLLERIPWLRTHYLGVIHKLSRKELTPLRNCKP